MIVVSDTSPLTALLTVGEADILLKLLAEVIIPRQCEANCSGAIPTSRRGCVLKE
jgi:predicted nucleic acid-binding protein